MKKVFLFILLSGIFLSGMIFAQENARSINVETGGYVFTDSLGYTNLAETSDSVLIINMNFAKGWIAIFLAGNANSTLDSVHVRAGSFIYDTDGDVVDTTFGSWAALKDSAWTDTNIMINNTIGKDYLMFRPVTQLLQFILMNYRKAVPTRNVQITVQAVN